MHSTEAGWVRRLLTMLGSLVGGLTAGHHYDFGVDMYVSSRVHSPAGLALLCSLLAALGIQHLYRRNTRCRFGS